MNLSRLFLFVLLIKIFPMPLVKGILRYPDISSGYLSGLTIPTSVGTLFDCIFRIKVFADEMDKIA